MHILDKLKAGAEEKAKTLQPIKERKDVQIIIPTVNFPF